MPKENCPECGEKLRRSKERLFGKLFPFAEGILNCSHCLWTEDDPPENASLVYEENFDHLN